MSDALWEYCVAVYAREPLARCCLELQDHYQANVNFLLLAAWLAEQGVCLSEAEFSALLQSVDAWHREAIIPLRKIRQDLKQWHEPNSLLATQIQQIREQVKATELAAERWEISRLQLALGAFLQEGVGEMPLAECFYANLRHYAVAAKLPESFQRSAQFQALLTLLSKPRTS